MVCPKCGRNGQKRPDHFGGHDYLHTGHDYGFAISYGEHCSVRPPNTASSRRGAGVGKSRSRRRFAAAAGARAGASVKAEIVDLAVAALSAY
jgi:hypothetical protein